MKFKLSLLFLFFGFAILCSAQQKIVWDKWNQLIGSWAGEGSGQPGQGGGTFSFSFDLDRNVIIRKSHTEYPASENKPKIIHDDLMIIYPDNNGIPSKAVYFDNEGHTIYYSITSLGNSLILTSEKTGNSPVFRLTYTFLENEIVNTQFAMSQDGINFMTYVEGKSRKTEN